MSPQPPFNQEFEDEGKAARRRIDEDQKKARAQAEADSQLIKEPVEVTLIPGRIPTLAELNAFAEQNALETNDIIHKTAVQVARVTKDVMKGVGVGSEQHKRFARKAGAERANAAAAAEAEAKKNK
jgi:hypothetical protein